MPYGKDNTVITIPKILLERIRNKRHPGQSYAGTIQEAFDTIEQGGAILLSPELRQRLDGLKGGKLQSYDDIIKALLDFQTDTPKA